jgi:hypothetical protein
LIVNSVFGLVGTALVPLVFDRIAPAYSIFALISIGPVIACLAVFAGQAAKRAIMSRFSNGAP